MKCRCLKQKNVLNTYLEYYSQRGEKLRLIIGTYTRKLMFMYGGHNRPVAEPIHYNGSKPSFKGYVLEEKNNFHEY